MSLETDFKAAQAIIKRQHWLVWAIGAVVVLDFVTGAWFGSQF